MPDALELLKTRRSLKPIEMTGPGPSAAELDTILTIGSRVPDHGKLSPWRFIVFAGDARPDREGTYAVLAGPARDRGCEQDRRAFQGARVGAGIVGGCQCDEHHPCRARARLRLRLGHGLARVRPRRDGSARPCAERKDRGLHSYRQGDQDDRGSPSPATRRDRNAILVLRRPQRPASLPPRPVRISQAIRQYRSPAWPD